MTAHWPAPAPEPVTYATIGSDDGMFSASVEWDRHPEVTGVWICGCYFDPATLPEEMRRAIIDAARKQGEWMEVVE